MKKHGWLRRGACAAITVLIAFSSLSCGGGGGGGGGGGIVGPKELNSGDMAPAGTYSHVFATAGTFNYHCIYHGVMTGTVTVTAGAAGADENIVIVATAAFPAKSITTGTKIIWTNNTAMTHTVTSN